MSKIIRATLLTLLFPFFILVTIFFITTDAYAFENTYTNPSFADIPNNPPVFNANVTPDLLLFGDEINANFFQATLNEFCNAYDSSYVSHQISESTSQRRVYWYFPNETWRRTNGSYPFVSEIVCEDGLVDPTTSWFNQTYAGLRLQDVNLFTVAVLGILTALPFWFTIRLYNWVYRRLSGN